MEQNIGRHARVRVGLSRRYRLAGNEVEKKPAVLSQANLHDCAGEKTSIKSLQVKRRQ